MARNRIPAYVAKEDRGVKYAVVTLTDAETKKRKTYRLGRHDTPASRSAYLRILAEWEHNSRRLPGAVPSGPVEPTGTTIAGVCYEFWTKGTQNHSASHRGELRVALRVLLALYADTAAAEFGPNALRLVREAMIAGDEKADPPRRPWARQVANKMTRYLVGVFKWAVAHEMIEPSVYQALRTIEPLKRGRTKAHETEPVKPVADAWINAVMDYLPRPVGAMVDLQLLTGMRPGEVVAMRAADIDMSGAVWLYRPAEHKTAHRGHERTIALGPQAQSLLKPFLKLKRDAYLFSPADAVADLLKRRREGRKTPAGQGNEPGTNRQVTPKRAPRDRYDVASYRRAIARACDQANAATIAAAAEAGQELDADARLVPRWHPHQLRHNRGTEVRRRYGVEAARVALGHRHVDVTELYAERDQELMLRIAQETG